MGSVVCLLVEVSKSWKRLHFRMSTAPHVACVVPSGWARNLLIVTHFSLTDRRSAIILKNVFPLRIEKRPG